MEVLKLCFVLLLPLPMHLHSKETPEATAGKEYVTDICTNKTQHIVTVECKIGTERSWGEGCHLLYRHGQDLKDECDRRFTLMTENQIVFLHLRNLTQADHRSYNCSCSYMDGTYIFRQGLTVEDVIPSAGKRNHGAVSGVVFILVALVILGFIYRRRCHSILALLAPGCGFVNQTPVSLDQVDRGDTYASLQQPADDLYQTVTSDHLRHDTKANPENDIQFYYQDQEIYENA